MAEKESREIATKEKQQAVQPQEQTRPGRYYVPNVYIYEFDESLKLCVANYNSSRNGCVK